MIFRGITLCDISFYVEKKELNLHTSK